MTLMMFLDFDPKLSAVHVSCIYFRIGATLTIMHDLLLPPSESCNIRVSLESRYGTRACLAFNASTTLPKTKSEVLIAPDSFKRTPELAVRRLSSDPAKSTNESFPCTALSVATSTFSILTIRTACDLLDTEFNAVAPTVLAARAPSKICRNCCGSVMETEARSGIKIEPSGVALIGRSFSFGSRRSRT